MKAGMALADMKSAALKSAALGICYGNLAEHVVLSEPVEHALPCVLGGVLAIARPIVGDEAVRRAGIDDELKRLPGGLERLFHILDLIQFNTGVLGAVKAQHWRFDFRGEFDRVLRRGVGFVGEAAIEGDAGLEI